MKRTCFVLLCLVFIGGVFVQHINAEKRELIGARYPAISPDGNQIAFSYMGDLWLVSSKGGWATRLTDHVAYDREPIWSQDGLCLAFTSNRKGNNDVYIIKAKGGNPKQLTYHSGEDVATGFTQDGQWVLFRSNRDSMCSVFKISVKGENAIPVLDTYWSWPYDAKVSPSGSSFLFSLGMENGSWWRRGYQGSNSAKIWIKKFSDEKAVCIVEDSSNCFWPDWSSDGQRIYFVSDRRFKNKNIWSVAKDGSDLKPVTQFNQSDVKWLSVASKSSVAVYEREFGIWITDLNTGDSHCVTIEAPAETKDNRSFFIEGALVSEFRLSPDGKKIAAVVRGDIFVMSVDGGYARNITNSPWRERDIDWDKESISLVYVSDVNANPDLFMISALGNEKARRLTETENDELFPRFSPDGKWIAYYSGKREIRLINVENKEDILLIEDDFGGRFADNFVWSPDSRYLAVVAPRNGNQEIFCINIGSKKKFCMSNTAYDEGGPFWSTDGKFMLFSSNRYGHSFPEFTGKWDLYQLYLEPEKPEFDEDEFEKMFDTKEQDQKEKMEKKKDDTKTVEIKLKLENLDRQTSKVTNTLGNDSEYILSPEDNSTIYFVSNIDGKYHLWKTSLEKKKKGKYEPFMPNITNPRDLQCDKKGKSLYYLSSGRIGCITLNNKKNKNISFKTKIEIDKTADYEQMLGELYYTLLHYYYDPDFHHISWKDVYEKFRPVLQQVREDKDFYDYANEMIGYLNSSHTGMRPPRTGKIEEPSAHLGAVWKFKDGKIILKRIIENGPLYDNRDKIDKGDELIAVEGKAVNAGQNIWKSLNGKLEKRIRLTFKNIKSQEDLEVFLKPISSGAENRLLLEEWIKSRRKIVKEKTDDQVAYIYMHAMGRGDLARFLKELERDAVPRRGLILDLRFNFGGNVHDRVLQALTKPVYAKWRMRGLSETPQSTFGFADKPVVLITNEVTLSDGEMTANGFKTLKRGPIVGNTTYGWLIFTTSVRLMNGGSFRLPWWGCFTLDGKDLETSGGVKPDVFVINDLNHELNGQDPQLEKAIGKILELISVKK